MNKKNLRNLLLILVFSFFSFTSLASINNQEEKKNTITYTAEQQYLFKIIKNRRSVRKFKTTPIPKEHILKVLDIARSAPTSGNQQPWKFLVIQDRQKLNKLRDACVKNSMDGMKKRGVTNQKQITAYQKRMYTYFTDYLSAPVNIIVLTDSNSKYPSYNKHDGPLAAGYLMIAARALGYGTVFATDSIPFKVAKKVLNIPDNFQFVCFTPLGVPTEWPKAKGKKALKEFTVFEKFVKGVNYTLPKKRKVIKLSSKTLDKYIGEYQLNAQLSIKIFREGQKLFCQVTGQPKLEMFAEKEDFFFLKVADIQIKFNPDKKGAVSGLILYQSGQKIPGKKIK